MKHAWLLLCKHKHQITVTAHENSSEPIRGNAEDLYFGLPNLRLQGFSVPHE